MVSRLRGLYARYSNPMVDVCLATSAACFAVATIMSISRWSASDDRSATGMAIVGAFYLARGIANFQRVAKPALAAMAAQESESAAQASVLHAG